MAKHRRIWNENQYHKLVGESSRIKGAVILASGYGRRMRKTTCFPSKPMTMIGAKPLISYAIDLLIESGVEKVFIVYHSVTADVLKLADYDSRYVNYLEFIEEDIQKGTLLSFSRVKRLLEPPFLMVFEDIIAKKKDFISMLNIGKKYIGRKADLVIQTVNSPSLLSEKAFLTDDNNKVIKYQKNGITGKEASNGDVSYGGMVYLWVSDPFPLVDMYLSHEVFKFSIFLENYVSNHFVYKMEIKDMWDVDTPEAALMTQEILMKRGY